MSAAGHAAGNVLSSPIQLPGRFSTHLLGGWVASQYATGGDLVVRNRRKATTVEERENELVSLAVDLAEKQLAQGTASAQVITHYLKLATTRERLEKENISLKNELLKSQKSAMDSQKNVEVLYEKAIEAMKKYSGSGREEGTYDD